MARAAAPREPPESETRPRAANTYFNDPSYDQVDTATLTLPPELLHALRSLAPKKRHPKLPYVFASALLTVAIVTLCSRPMQEFLVERVRAYSAQAHLPQRVVERSVAAKPATPATSVEITKSARIPPGEGEGAVNAPPVPFAVRGRVKAPKRASRARH